MGWSCHKFLPCRKNSFDNMEWMGHGSEIGSLNVVCVYLMLTQVNLSSSVRLPGLASNFFFHSTRNPVLVWFQIPSFSIQFTTGTFLILKNV
jgi:hypothetical protein